MGVEIGNLQLCNGELFCSQDGFLIKFYGVMSENVILGAYISTDTDYRVFKFGDVEIKYEIPGFKNRTELHLGLVKRRVLSKFVRFFGFVKGRLRFGVYICREIK